MDLLQEFKLYGWKFVSIKVVIVHSDAQTDYDLYLWSMVCLRGLVWHETSTQSNFIQWVVDLQLGDTNKHWFIKNRTKLISILCTTKIIKYELCDEPIFLEQNLRFGLVLGLLAVMKTAQPKQLLATFKGSFF